MLGIRTQALVIERNPKDLPFKDFFFFFKKKKKEVNFIRIKYYLLFSYSFSVIL
jgi:hypothetical protein